MSLGQITSLREVFEKIKQLKAEGKSEKEIAKVLQDLALADFPKYFGRYESSSGRMWFEMYQQSGDVDGGAVVFRKGETNVDKLEEDLILQPIDAFRTFQRLAAKGYWPVFSAKTKADIDAGNQGLIRGNEDILGLFVKDKAFIRIDCYGENYSLQRGYGTTMTSAVHEQTEEQAREFVQEALNNGFHRKGVATKSEPKRELSNWAASLDLD